MDNNQFLEQLKQKITSGEITEVQVRHVLESNISESYEHVASRGFASRFSVMKLLYVIGVLVIVLGVCFFIEQMWDSMGAIGRVMVTLGVGLSFTAGGLALTKQKPEQSIGGMFLTIGGAVIPGGMLVLLNEMSRGGYHPFAVGIGFLVVSVFYLLLCFAQKHVVLTFYAIANATAAAVFLVIGAIENMHHRSYNFHEEYYYEFLMIIIGATYIGISYLFRKTYNAPLRSILHSFGAPALLGGGMLKVMSDATWTMPYFLLLGALVYLSILIRSRSILVWSALFLIVHISYITGKYFADSIGWPLALILLGFVFLGLGYAIVNINKKYISSQLND